jgi:hypothetical protein
MKRLLPLAILLILAITGGVLVYSLVDQSDRPQQDALIRAEFNPD